MSENIRVDFNIVAQLAADMQLESNNQQAALDDLDAQVATLRANWDGEAQLAYTERKKRWSQAMEDQKMLLTEMSRLVDDARTQYINTETANANRFRA